MARRGKYLSSQRYDKSNKRS
ncbi:uncharacterized protein G2W53_018683 [Senna tora]|uniref:Uncharacterized protein n=1 Tax=Senna tora TaxID=362788 RepID=A0A834U0X2_9FABA|nr:uncharacterized protein G2W53_018683 [Senna tora]